MWISNKGGVGGAAQIWKGGGREGWAERRGWVDKGAVKVLGSGERRQA